MTSYSHYVLIFPDVQTAKMVYYKALDKNLDLKVYVTNPLHMYMMNQKAENPLTIELYCIYLLVPGMRKFVVSLLQVTAQGSYSAAPMGRGYGNNGQGSHAVAPSNVGDRHMMMTDKKIGSLAHTPFIQGCPA